MGEVGKENAEEGGGLDNLFFFFFFPSLLFIKKGLLGKKRESER